jgi:uncharacterized membrane protein YdbT with pleckstrin-like domain
MSYVDRVLQPGERVLARATLHWVIYLNGLFALLAAAVVAVAASRAQGFEDAVRFIALLLAAVGAVLLVRAWYHRWGMEIAVTNRRVIYKTGIVRRRTVEMNVEQIESVEVKQSILGRILGYGSIGLHGTGAGTEIIPRVADPLTLRNAVTARE